MKVLDKIRQAGFFRPHFRYGTHDAFLSVDGRTRSLTISDGKDLKTAYYNEYGVPERFGSNSNPTRAELQAYDQMWTNVVAIITNLRPEKLGPVRCRAEKWYPSWEEFWKTPGKEYRSQ